MIFAISDLQVTLILPTKFQVNWSFGSGGKAQNRFSRWWPSWIYNQNDYSNFDLQVAQILPTKFHVNRPFGFGVEAQNRFSRWPPSWISDQNDFSYF